MKIYKLDNIKLDNINLFYNVILNNIGITYNSHPLLIELPYLCIHIIDNNYIYISLKSTNNKLTKLVNNFFELFDNKIINDITDKSIIDKSIIDKSIIDKSIIDDSIVNKSVMYKSVIYDVSSSIDNHFNIYKDKVLKLNMSKVKLFDKDNNLLNNDYNQILLPNMYIKIIIHIDYMDLSNNIYNVNIGLYQIKLL